MCDNLRTHITTDLLPLRVEGNIVETVAGELDEEGRNRRIRSVSTFIERKVCQS